MTYLVVRHARACSAVRSPPLTLIEAQEFTPLSPAPLTTSRSLDLTGLAGAELAGRRMEPSPDLDSLRRPIRGRSCSQRPEGPPG